MPSRHSAGRQNLDDWSYSLVNIGVYSRTKREDRLKCLESL